MNLQGPIVIIEDDADESMMLEELIELHAPAHEVIIINDTKKALDTLRAIEKPFLILSGVNLSALDGFQLRSLILADASLSRKCTPYIFYAAHSNNEMLSKVYDMQANGYFHDITDYTELGDRLSMIIKYWQQSTV